MKLPVSLMIITLNEEHNIERCIGSVPWASEVLVIDSGSTDKTLEIAEKMGAKVLSHAWQGFGPQKKWGTARCQFDWILSLDADEALSPMLAEEISRRFTSLDPETGYEMKRLSFHLGKWIHHGGWFPDPQLRLYNRKHIDWPETLVHERIEAHRKVRLEENILHYVFKSLSHQVQTNNRYSTLLAEKDFASEKRFSLLRLLHKPIGKFLESYFFKAGWKDGLPGFIIAVGASYSIFLRQAKIWEIEKKEQL
jgi:glycosyltransferase involved in cell wall biosynthesis